LPALVVRADRFDVPLLLRYREGRPAFTVGAERALVQVYLAAGGMQQYRVRYRLNQLLEREVELELPAPVPTLGLRVALGGKRIDPEVLAEEDAQGVRGRVVRLRLPPLERVFSPDREKPELSPSSPDSTVRPRPGEPAPASGRERAEAQILEVVYQLPPGRLEVGRGGPLRTLLAPPVLRGAPPDVPTRWQVVAPSGWVLLGPEQDPGVEWTWGLRGWLLSPRPALSAIDLDHWLTGSAEATGEGTLTGSSEGVLDPGSNPILVCWRSGAEPVYLLHVPQQLWLLFCSLGLLLLGLLGMGHWTAPNGKAGSLAPGSLSLRGLVVVTAGGVLLVAAVLFWPTLTGQVAYGCQPGLVVLLPLLVVQWLFQERRRRRIVFLPAFSQKPERSSASGRRGEGSSVSPGRAEATPAPAPRRGEPSTVDAPVGPLPLPPGNNEDPR
jgi:hypothetical protein